MKRGSVAGLLCGVIILLTFGLSGCGSSTQPIGVALTPSGSKGIDQAQTVAITASVSHDSKSAGVQWAVSGGGTLSAQTPTSATYNAPASVPSPFTATVTAASITDPSKSAALQIKVSPPPAITTTSLAAATAGTAYSATLTESGGTSPYTWTVNPTTLPAGLSLNSSTGVISGTPTGGGSGSFTFQVADAAGMTATQAITITVNAPPTLTVTTASLAAGMMGTAYSQTLQASGGVPSYKWSLSAGSLPAGLTLSSAGLISGTPTGTFTGTTNFAVTVTDSQTPTNATATANLSITVSAPLLKVTTTTLAGGTMGNPYSQTLQASGGAGAYSWAVTTGSLPAGLSLSSGGVISGSPSGKFVGTTAFTVTVTDSETPTAQTANASLSITITVAPLVVTTTSGSLPQGVANSVYAGATLQATGGIQPYSWAVTTGSLPAGLTLNSGTGAISGTPTSAGTTNFTVTVTDSETPTAKTATANLSIVVNPPVSVTTTSLAAGVIGAGYNQTLQAAGGITPYSWAVTVGALPSGLSLNAGTGAITGTPTGPFVGTTNFTVTVTDSESPAKTATAALSITISATTLNITTTTLPTGVINVAYSATLQAAGGVSPYTWALATGSLPAGLSLDPNTGAITGTPTVLGTSTFKVTVTDSEIPTQQTATSADLSISINSSAPLGIITTTLPSGIVNTSYPNTTLQAGGGVPPYTWSISVGTLPAGLSLTSAGCGSNVNCAITGTPTASGTSNFTVKVTDSTKPTANTKTAALSITINAALAITTTTLPGGSIGTAYSATVQATGGQTPYNWSITSGTLPAGLSMNSNGNISGTPTATGTSTFTVQVADSESPVVTATASLSITITAQACTNNALLSGHYAFLVNGWKGATDATSAAGSFVADGAGNLSSGNLDVAEQTSGTTSGTFTGTYCVTANNLTTVNMALDPPFSGSTTFEAALDSSDSNGHIISYDANSSAIVTGLLRKQDPTAFLTSKIKGNYAFGLVGADQNSSRFAVAGELNSNGSGSVSGENDIDDNGTVQAQQTFTSSDFTVASTGRGTLTTTSSNGNMNMIVYVVSASELLMMAADTHTPPMIMAGQVLLQTGPFTNASLNGKSVIELQDLDIGNTPATPETEAGILTTNGAGSFSVTLDDNDGGVLDGGTGNPMTLSGNYSVASNGRMTLSNVVGGGGGNNHNPVFYLIGPNQAFAVGTDTGAIFGMFVPQVGSNFTNASLTGNYFGGSQQPVSTNVSVEVDSIHADGAGNITGTSDDNNSFQGPNQGGISATYTVSPNGRVVVKQGNTTVVIWYIVSGSQAVVLPAQDNNPKLIDFHK